MYYLIENINDYHYNENDLLLLKKEKKKEIKKRRNILDQKRSLLGELLLIKGLKEFYNINYNDIKIKYNSYGKPYIDNNPIYYNISHKGDYVICVFSNYQIGVDIEVIKDININLINYIASEEEKDYILENKDLINQRFFTIYTKKEAYFKMIGQDLKRIKEINIQKQNIIYNTIFMNNYVISICQKTSH